jgi:hypothetical protein
MKHTMADYVHVAVNLDNDTTAILTFMIRGTSPTLPSGAHWSATPGVWERPPVDATLFAEITKAFPTVDQKGLPKPLVVGYKLVDFNDIPKDRTYRNALRHTEKGFQHDLAKAKEIHLGRIRRARETTLGKLDRDWMKATGQGNKPNADAIEAERQALRDLPVTVDLDSATTIEELKALWPANLPRL